MTDGPVCKILIWTAKRKNKKISLLCGAVQGLKGSTAKSHQPRPSGMCTRGKPQSAHCSLHHPPPFQKTSGQTDASLLQRPPVRDADLPLSVTPLGGQPQDSGELTQFGGQLPRRGRMQACANLSWARPMPPLPMGNLTQGHDTPRCQEAKGQRRLVGRGRCLGSRKSPQGLRLGQRYRGEVASGTRREWSRRVLCCRRASLFISKRKEISNPQPGRSKLQNTKLLITELSE